MKMITRILASLLCTFGYAQAASGCTALYGVNSSNPGSLMWVSVLDGGTHTVTTLSSTGTLNGLALHPVTGDLWFARGTTIQQYDTETGTLTAPMTITMPTNSGNRTATTVVGASFNNSGTNPMLFLLFDNYVIYQINPTTKTVVSRFQISLSGTTARVGTSLYAVTPSTITSGDIVFDGATLYAVTDAQYTGGGGPIYANYGSSFTNGSTITGTGGVAIRTPDRTGFRINGIAQDPINHKIYVTLTDAAESLWTMDPSTGLITSLNNRGITPGFNDLSDCQIAPDAPVVSKSFSPSVIRTGQISKLTINVSNNNPSSIYLQKNLVDTLPAGMVIASPPNASTDCKVSNGLSNASVVAVAGGTTVTLNTETRIPASGCSVNVNVTVPNQSELTNVINAGQLNTTGGDNAQNATATLKVQGPAGINSYKKLQRNVSKNGTLSSAVINGLPGETIEYCLEVIHDSRTAAATSAVIRDTLNSNLIPLNNAYGAGQDAKITINNGAATYRSFAADTDGTTLSGQQISISLNNVENGNTIQACFQTRIRSTGIS